MQNKVYVEAQIEWPKLQESDRDMGNNLKEGSDLVNTLLRLCMVKTQSRK